MLEDERKETTTGFLLRTLRWLRALGIQAERITTDNGSAYRSRHCAKALRLLAIRHIFTRRYTPKTNGKGERFIQTVLRGWANSVAHPSPKAGTANLPRWLDWFNLARPHSTVCPSIHG